MRDSAPTAAAGRGGWLKLAPLPKLQMPAAKRAAPGEPAARRAGRTVEALAAETAQAGVRFFGVCVSSPTREKGRGRVIPC